MPDTAETSSGAAKSTASSRRSSNSSGSSTTSAFSSTTSDSHSSSSSQSSQSSTDDRDLDGADECHPSASPTTPVHDALYEQKDKLIQEILTSPSLYTILGCLPNTPAPLLRRHYLDRCKLIHPDKPPAHPLSTPAFQRLSHAYEILKKPSLRAHYDRESARGRPTETGLGDDGAEGFLRGEQTFKGAVAAVVNEFLSGDFRLVRRLLETLGRQYPNLVNEEMIVTVERTFTTLLHLCHRTSLYALLLYIELGRVHRVQRRLLSLGYLDVFGRLQLTMQLVKVTLAIPVRVDRALRRRKEREWRAKEAAWEARGEVGEGVHGEGEGGVLSERVSKVLEFLVGSEVEDMPEDGEKERRWGGWWGGGAATASGHPQAQAAAS